MKKSTLILAALFVSMAVSAKTITLDLTHPTNPEAFTFNEAGMWTETWNDQDYPWFETQEFAFSHILSGNSYGGTSWEGFTVSKATKDGEGYGYYSNMAKGGLAGEGTPYILAYYSEFWLMNEDNEDMMSSNQIIFGEPLYPQYVYLNNALVSYENIKNGGGAARPFAQGDKFEVWIQGITEDLDDVTDEKVVYRLADYTSENQEEWFVNTEWAKVDLTPLGKVYGLAFTVVSTDQGIYGTNTATYFALDGLTVSDVEPLKVATFENEEGGINLITPESAWQGSDDPQVGANKWKSGDFTFTTSVADWGSGYLGYMATTVSNETSNEFTGYEYYRNAKGGAYEGDNFAIWTDAYSADVDVEFAAQEVPGFFINNTAYAVNSMLNGDAYAKIFGKDDWFRLTIKGYLNGVAVNNEVKVDLAADGKYINQWTYVDLSVLGEVDAIKFSMWSSDVVTYDEGVTYYMNTPAYFAMDNFGAEMPAGYVAPEMAEFPEEQGIEDTEAAVKAVKVLRDGQIVIVRGEVEYTVTGLRVK